MIPNKAFEALACGTPLLTADTLASRELLEDGETALLGASGDPAALAAAVERLAGDSAPARESAKAVWRVPHAPARPCWAHDGALILEGRLIQRQPTPLERLGRLVDAVAALARASHETSSRMPSSKLIAARSRDSLARSMLAKQ